MLVSVSPILMWLVKTHHLIFQGGLALARRAFAAASLISCEGEARPAVGSVAGLQSRYRHKTIETIKQIAMSRFMVFICAFSFLSAV
jgi:hypothetical protein